MTQLTIRGFSTEIQEKIQSVARERGWSQNKAAIHLLKKGAGMRDKEEAADIGNGLDAFIGTWKRNEADAFDRCIEEAFESIDEEMWG